jgi:uncharacterized protein YsxB (DUF464 family)
MIRVRLLAAEDGRLSGFAVQGHAHYAEAGYDIVCAGVSALAQTAESALEKYLSRAPVVETSPGREDPRFRVKVLLPGQLSAADRRAAEIILGTLELGLQMMAKEYGSYISLRRCRDDSGKI